MDPQFMGTILRVKMNLQHIGFWFMDTFTSLNSGIEFSPLIACWIFILAAVNWIFPSMLPSYFNWMKISAYFRLFRRCLTIWLMYYFVWVPANRALFWTLKEYLSLPVTLCQQWLPFLSLVLSIYTLALSMSYSGLLHFARLKSKLAWVPLTLRERTRSVNFRPRSPSPRRRRGSGHGDVMNTSYTRAHLRTTRSGTIFGVWDI